MVPQSRSRASDDLKAGQGVYHEHHDEVARYSLSQNHWQTATLCDNLVVRYGSEHNGRYLGSHLMEQVHVKTRLLGAEDLASLLDIVGRDQFMDLMIERMRSRFADESDFDARARDGFRYDKPALGLIEWMPTHEIGGPVVVKMVGYHPTNPIQRGLPSVLATSSMWDTETGHLTAIADATLLTAIRTGAASGIATDILAREGPTTVGIIGLGAQAVTQLHAISRVRTIERVIGYDPSGPASCTFASRVEFIGAQVDVVGADDLDKLVGAVDVLCTCTSVDVGAGPVMGDGPVRQWLHINAVGADFPGKLELPVELIRRSIVYPDSLAQCLAEGECQQVPASRIGPALPDLVRNEEAHHPNRNKLTVFDSTGWAVEDEIALRLLLELADRHDLGSTFALESIPIDPYDPYAPPRI